MDHEAGFLAATGTCARPLQVSLGTAWVGNFLVDNPHVGYAPVQLVIPSPCGPGNLVVQPLLTGNTSWDWGLQTLVDEDQARAFAAAEAIFAERLLPSPGVACLPWFTQRSAFAPSAPGGGTFVGLGAHTPRTDLVRALAAGMCCEFHRVFEHVASAGLVDGLVVGGGASKGAFFGQILAALFGPLPVWSVVDEDLAGARGALHALCPAIAQAQTIRVPMPGPEVARGVHDHAAIYRQLFADTLGDGGAAAPYRVFPA
jgi:sugar (pentulose or hexulose) kinase